MEVGGAHCTGSVLDFEIPFRFSALQRIRKLEGETQMLQEQMIAFPTQIMALPMMTQLQEQMQKTLHLQEHLRLQKKIAEKMLHFLQEKKAAAMKEPTTMKAAKAAAMKKPTTMKAKQCTAGGVTKDKLKKNKHGKVVSKAGSAAAKSAAAKANFARSPMKKWNDATKAARKALGCVGPPFVPVGGKTVAGKALYAKAKSLM